MSETPELRKVKAIDVVPYHWALWCTVEGGAGPFANEIVLVRWNGDGTRLSYMLESHNFMSADPDEDLELVPLVPSSTCAELGQQQHAELLASWQRTVAMGALIWGHHRGSNQADFFECTPTDETVAEWARLHDECHPKDPT